MNLRTILFQASAIQLQEVDTKAIYSPLPDLLVEVEIKSVSARRETTYVNGKWCGNRQGAVGEFGRLCEEYLKVHGVPFELYDQATESKKPAITIRVKQTSNFFVTVSAPGYGDYDSTDDSGAPIAIEYYGNTLRTLLYADINKSDPEIHDLWGAAIKRRKPVQDMEPLPLDIDLGEVQKVLLHFHKYENGRLAIAVTTEYGEPYGKLSINVTSAQVGDNEFVAKLYSDNEGWAEKILDALPEVFINTKRVVQTGHTVSPLYRFNPDGIKR